jgi:hypothetical protein
MGEKNKGVRGLLVQEKFLCFLTSLGWDVNRCS